MDADLAMRECLSHLDDTKNRYGYDSSFFEIYAYAVLSGHFDVVVSLEQKLLIENGIEPALYRFAQMSAEGDKVNYSLDDKFKLVHRFLIDESARKNLKLFYSEYGFIFGHMLAIYNLCMTVEAHADIKRCLKSYYYYREAMFSQGLRPEERMPARLLTIFLDKDLAQLSKNLRYFDEHFGELKPSISNREILEATEYFSEKKLRNNIDRFMFVLAINAKIEYNYKISNAERRRLGGIMNIDDNEEDVIVSRKTNFIEKKETKYELIPKRSLDIFTLFGDIVVNVPSYFNRR